MAPYDLSKIMHKKLAPAETSSEFKAQTFGDKLIFQFNELKTVNTKRGEEAVVCECVALAGQKFDQEAKKVAAWPKGPASFFLSSNLSRLFRVNAPIKGDIIHIEYVEDGPNREKRYGWEWIKKVPRPEPEMSDDDIGF